MVDQKIRYIANQLGVKFYARDCLVSCGWNGKTIATICNGEIVSDSDLIHELAHWFISKPNRRKLYNYGLGNSPDDLHGKQLEEDKNLDIDHEECLASCLGILIEKKLGYDWSQTYMDHNWDFQLELSSFDDYENELKDMGIVIDDMGVPRYRS